MWPELKSPCHHLQGCLAAQGISSTGACWYATNHNKVCCGCLKPPQYTVPLKAHQMITAAPQHHNLKVPEKKGNTLDQTQGSMDFKICTSYQKYLN
jgi:hypothetical protein